METVTQAVSAPVETTPPAAAAATTTTRKETPPPATSTAVTVTNEVVPVQKDSPKSLATKEKLNKKKKNELISNQTRHMSKYYTCLPKK